MIGQLIGAFVKLRLKEGCDGDWADRLNHKYTAVLLVTFASFVAAKQYGGNPINCWCPGHFEGQWVEYTNSICWVQNTYFLPFNIAPEAGKMAAKDLDISYYQWIPVILFVMSIMFYFPYILWKQACSSVGLDVDSLVSSLTTFDSTINSEIWSKTLSHAARQIERYIESQREIRSGYLVSAKKALIFGNKRRSDYLTSFYLCLKTIYVINIFAQIAFLNWLLGYSFKYYGLNVIDSRVTPTGLDDGYRRFPAGPEFEQTFGFPHVSLCDFRVRILGNLHQYTVQCVLNINLFNEKIFAVLWFWLAFVAVLTSLNFFMWIFRIVWRNDRLSYVRKHLKFLDRIQSHGSLSNSDNERRAVRKFVNAYLRSDGVFLIRLISRNTSSIVTSELVAQLFDDFMSQPRFNCTTQMHPQKEAPQEPECKERLMFHTSTPNIPPPTFESALTASAPMRTGIELVGDYPPLPNTPPPISYRQKDPMLGYPPNPGSRSPQNE